MKVTVLKQENKKQKQTLIPSLIMLLFGILLLFYSTGLLNILFRIAGVVIIGLGCYQYYQAFCFQKETQIPWNNFKVSAFFWIFFGLFMFLCASFFTNAIQLLTGIWFLFLGVDKLANAFYYRDMDKQIFYSSLVGAILFFIFGFYTIFATNVVFVFLGIVLILYSVYDIIAYFKTK